MFFKRTLFLQQKILCIQCTVVPIHVQTVCGHVCVLTIAVCVGYLQLEQRGYPLPTVDFIRKKSKRIEQAKSFQFKEEDIEKVT